MNTPILKTKLHCPPTPAKHVPREALLQKLNQGLAAERPLTLISAPAGFGKTTCASEWLNTLDIPTAWLSLEPTDDDPPRFFSYLIAALQTVHPELGRELEAVIRSGQMPDSKVVSASLINEMLTLESRFLLVLDDFHTLQDTFILDVLDQIITQQPLPLHLVLISREDPVLPLARLRANNRLTEVRARDLRFSGEDISAFFKETIGFTLSPQNLATLEKKTEGWAVGLQLAGLSLQEKADPSTFITNLSGNHRYIMEYLTEQVLDQQPPEIRQFLLQTSILESLQGDLCNAVTGRADAGAMLEHLYNANLFLIPLDDEHLWYRYHHLFADLLRDLRRRDAAAKASDHQHASRWYASAGMWGEAIGHALSAEDFPAAVALLENHASELIMQGYAKTVNAWVQAIPENWRAQSPRINLAFAWAYVMRGAYGEVSRHLDQLDFPEEPAHATGTNPAMRAEWLVLKSMVLFMQGETSTCMAMATEALELTPQNDYRVRSLATFVQGSVYQLWGDFLQADALFQESIEYGRQSGSLFSEMMSTISLSGAAHEHGQLRKGFRIASQGIQRLKEANQLSPIVGFIYLSLGDIHYQWFRFQESENMARHALHLNTLGGYNTGLIFCHLLLSSLHLAQGELTAAEDELRQAADLVPAESPEYLRQDVASQQVRVYLAKGQPDAAEKVLLPWGFHFGSPSTLPDPPSGHANPFSTGALINCGLQTLLAKEHLSRADLQAGLSLADRLIADALQGQQVIVALESLVLRARFHARLRNAQAGMADLRRALELGLPEGFIGVFASQGKALVEMLPGLLRAGGLEAPMEAYAQKLLTTFVRPLPTRTPFETLTEQETNVLQLIAEGLTYQEVASRLVISINTVRYHVKAIYGKLGVNNRTQAIAQARELQLL